jgi:membrane-associated phospholipid phosphatase
MNSAIVFGAAVVALAALTHRWRGPLLVATVLVLAIGFTRVALGVHYLSDVIGGWSLGLAWVILGSLTIVGRAAPDPGGATRTGGRVRRRERQ